MAHISKQDLKKNELADILNIAGEWIRNNRNQFYTIAATAAGVILLAVFFYVRKNQLKAVSEDKLAVAQSLVYSGQAAQGIAYLDELIANSGVEVKAIMVKADFLMNTGKFSDAEQLLQRAVSIGRPKTLMPLVLVSLGAAQEDQGKFAEAARTYNDFLNAYPDHFIAPKAYEALARTYELTNAPNEARSAYEKLVTLYPATQWAQRAQERLMALQPDVSQNIAKPLDK
jgi:TolA-binding protein